MDISNSEPNLEENVDGLPPQIDEVAGRLRSLNDKAMGFIKEHPAACLLGAVALGYLIARLARRQKS